VNFELNEDQLAYQKLARDFATKSLAPFAAEWDANSVFPVDVLREGGQLGFCGLYSPESCGGLGLSRLDSALVFEELAAADPSTAAFFTIHNMATWMLCSWGQAALTAEVGPKLTSGEYLASYCLTEPDAGSDAANLKTSAKRDGDDYVLNGAKAFISGAGSTDWLVVMARTGVAGAKGITAFAVPADAAGVRYGKKEEKMGWNSQPTGAIFFDQVRIPASYRLGEEGEGFRIAMKGLDGGRINIATCSVGAAQGALNAAQRYLGERKQFGQALSQITDCP